MKILIFFIFLIHPGSVKAVGSYTSPCEEQEKQLRDALVSSIKCLRKSAKVSRKDKASEVNSCPNELSEFSNFKIKLIECLMKDKM